MVEDTRAPAGERVVITIDSAAFSESTIDYAVRVAALLKRPLHGVFLEDIDLLSCAALPFATEICLQTGQPRALDSGILQSAFGDALLRFRESLARRAEREAVQWTVSSVRGRRRDFPLADLSQADYCIFEPAHSHPRVGRAAGKVKRLLVIDGSGEAFYRVLGGLLQPLAGSEIHVTLAEPGVESAEAAAWLPAGTHLHALPGELLAATLSRAEDVFDFVVVSRQRWAGELPALLAQLHCPLILVG